MPWSRASAVKSLYSANQILLLLTGLSKSLCDTNYMLFTGLHTKMGIKYNAATARIQK